MVLVTLVLVLSHGCIIMGMRVTQASHVLPPAICCVIATVSSAVGFRARYGSFEYAPMKEPYKANYGQPASADTKKRKLASPNQSEMPLVKKLLADGTKPLVKHGNCVLCYSI